MQIRGIVDIVMIVMVCWNLGSPLEQVVACSIDHAVSVRVSQPQPAPMDYPTSNTPKKSCIPTAVLRSLCS
jgi:hypothetical protein